MSLDKTLIHGDCLSVIPDRIQDGTVDLVLCDLPYGKTQCDWDVELPIDRLWPLYWKACKPKAAILLFGIEPFASRLRLSSKFYRYDLVWHKKLPTGFLNAKRMPLRAHETISVFYRELPTYNPQKTTGHAKKTAHRKTTSPLYGEAKERLLYSSTERYPTSVIQFGNDKQKSALHPTQKPVALLEWLIKMYSNPGDVVLDNAMGSGSAGVAAINTDRRFIGIEKDEKYFAIATERLSGLSRHGRPM